MSLALTTAGTPSAPVTRVQGGFVEAREQPDGSVVVEGLPFFSEVREEDPGAQDGTRMVRGFDWLAGALDKHRARAALGHRPIMTLRHIFDEPLTVGHYELTHVAPLTVNPGEEPRATLFGRKVYESRDAFETAKDYQFRSAEVSPDAPDELGALALLKDKLPFHKYANTKERLAPGVQEAFEAALVEAFRSRMGEHAQAWRGPTEAFEQFGSPDQKRAEDGKWTDGGGSGKSDSKSSGSDKKPSTEDLKSKLSGLEKKVADAKANHGWTGSANDKLLAKTAMWDAAQKDNPGHPDAVGIYLRKQGLTGKTFYKSDHAKKLAADHLAALEKKGSHESLSGLEDHDTYGAAASADAATSAKKEGVMPAETKTETKAPSIEERMEACLAKFEERMVKAFEDRVAKAAGLKAEKEDAGAEKKPEASSAAPQDEKKEEKKPEAAQSAGPNDSLPPALSESRKGEHFSQAAPKNQETELFAAKAAALETANLGLKARLDKLEREKEAVGIVASAKKSLDGNVSEAFEQRMFQAAVSGGGKAVDALVADVKLYMGSQRQPEAYGAMGSVATQTQDPLKKAIETYASRPEDAGKRTLLTEMFVAYQEAPEHMRRALGPFDRLVGGDSKINPAILSDRGGRA